MSFVHTAIQRMPQSSDRAGPAIPLQSRQEVAVRCLPP